MIFAQYKIFTLKWDKKEGDFFYFLSMMKKGDGAILDIGANIGIMTTHLSQSHPDNKIFSIEPMPENLQVLQRIIQKKKLKNVSVFPVAVGAVSGKLSMVMPTENKAKLQGLSHVKTLEITEWNEGEEFEVDVITLDELFESERIQGIKMDVENYEFQALKGAEQLIRKNHPIIYTELWDNDNRKNCFVWMKELGYQVRVLVNKELVIFDEKTHKHQNFFFLPN
jgi:FkbM family methyltransferase